MAQFFETFFLQNAYNPALVYTLIVGYMLLSAVGMPIPEELCLVSVGFIAHVAMHPDLYPPPHPGAVPVNPYSLAVVAFLSVVGSDFLIYWIGHRFGSRVFEFAFFKRMVSDESLERAKRWTRQYGSWPVFLFRFTPGVRFPGHLLCGAMGLSRVRFLAVDAVAAAISVPTQILVIAHYGREILSSISRFKTYFFGGLFLLFLLFLLRKWLQARAERSASGSGQ